MNSAGYLAIVFLMFLENVFPPIPSELIMPLAGFTATQGKLTLVGVIIAGTVGSVLGALPLYYVGKVIGEERIKKWAGKYGKWLTVSPDDIDKSKQWFDKHGGVAVGFGRLVPGIRSLIAVPAGFDNMKLAPFVIYTALGSALWSGILAYLGFLLGGNYEKVAKFVGPASYVVLGIVVAVYIWRVVKQHKKESAH